MYIYVYMERRAGIEPATSTGGDPECSAYFPLLAGRQKRQQGKSLLVMSDTHGDCCLSYRRMVGKPGIEPDPERPKRPVLP